MGLQNRSLSGLLQSDIQGNVTKSGPPGIKVLENVKISGGFQPKVFSNSSKMIDMSKLSVINSKPNNGNALVLLPDGKIKNLAAKVPGKRIFLNIMDSGLNRENFSSKGSRYITSKRQLIGNKPPKPVRKIQYVPQNLPTSLPPPTNLTTQDIMDLPIIFADDNQILDNTIQPEIKPLPQLITSPPSKFIPPGGANKFMVINKPQNFIISPNPKIVQPKVQPKYTKIILSSKRAPEVNVKKNLPETVVRKAPDVFEEIDLENEIAASTLYKEKIPDHAENLEESKIAETEVKFDMKRNADAAQIIESEAEGTPSKISKVN